MKLTLNNFLTQIKNIIPGGGTDADGRPLHDSGFIRRAELSLSDLQIDSGIEYGGGSGIQSSTPLTTINIGGTANTTLVAVSSDLSGTTTDATAINDNFEDIGTQLNAAIADIADLYLIVMGIIGSGGTAVETNGVAVRVPQDTDTVGTWTFVIPRDYDEETDYLKLRVLATQEAVGTDNDVKLDVQVYRKRGSAALSADLAPSFTSDSDVPVLQAIGDTTDGVQWSTFDLSGLGMQRDDVLFIRLITNTLNDTGTDEILLLASDVSYASTLVSYDHYAGNNPNDPNSGEDLRGG